jgi:hypothetical protein
MASSDHRAGAGGQHNPGVRDIDAQRAACAEANVALGDLTEYPGIVKTVDAVDPDGNKVTFVQDLSG